MKKINKKLMIILLSGFVLMTGCKNSNTISPKDVASKTTSEETPITSDKPEINESNKEEKLTGTVAETNTQTVLAEVQTPEEKITNYVNDINNSIDSESIKENAIKKFIILTDFIFYDTEINGIKFNDLKEETKEDVYNAFCNIDALIMTFSPDYKENIGEKYEVVKDFTSKTYYNALDKIREAIGDEKYDKVKEIKDNTKEKIKDGTDNAKEYIKKKYENWRDR